MVVGRKELVSFTGWESDETNPKKVGKMSQSLI